MRSAFAVAMLVVTLGVSISLAQPPKDHVLWFKVVGRVLDRNGLPIHWGRVYLKDTHSHLLRIRAVDNGGHFSLLGLDAQLDYEVYGVSRITKVTQSGTRWRQRKCLFRVQKKLRK